MTGLLGAVQFLTRIPLRLPAPVAHARTVPWFPVVGALIGVGCAGVAVGLSFVVPLPVAAVAGLLAGLLITGAFHEDGLADVADAFGGGWDREQRLRILKDPRHGTYGVAALTGSVLLRAACAGTLGDRWWLGAGFVAAHAVGRTAVVVALFLAPAAAESGLGADVRRELRPAAVVAGVLAGCMVAGMAAGWWAIPLAAAAAVGTVATVALAVRKIGGLSGDVLGAVEQVAECLVWLALSAVLFTWA